MLGLTWRPSARRKLLHFIDYVSDRDEQAATRLLATIEEAVEFARQFPHAYRIGRKPGTREIVAHPNYIVVYAILPDRIRVISVLHARQKYP
jgi:toxin ParE1/3/4